jgi:hypothetical protein
VKVEQMMEHLLAKMKANQEQVKAGHDGGISGKDGGQSRKDRRYKSHACATTLQAQAYDVLHRAA